MPNPWTYLGNSAPLGAMRAVVGFGMHPALPLQGLTVLAVEDSRYACDALRLMCQKAGARLRRAETLAVARAHLRVYRPDVVIIDLGLPDGDGEALIADLAGSGPRPGAVLGTSGDPMGRSRALGAGADGFLDKPYASFAAFCTALRAHLPDDATLPDAVALPNGLAQGAISPDPLALQDDLAMAARNLAGDPDAATRRYVAGFLSGIADHANDATLAKAAAMVGATDTDRGFRQLRDLVADRLATANAFLPRAG